MVLLFYTAFEAPGVEKRKRENNPAFEMDGAGE
jgi:hypothetical protein